MASLEPETTRDGGCCDACDSGFVLSVNDDDDDADDACDGCLEAVDGTTARQRTVDMCPPSVS